jgi:hypothetical protein
VNLWQCALYGAAGGALAGLVDFYQRFAAWRAACGVHLSQNSPGPSPTFFYPREDFYSVLLQVVLGCVGGLLFGGSGQVDGPYAILVVGASAPALLFNVVNGSASQSQTGSSSQNAQTTVAAATAGQLPPVAIPAAQGAPEATSDDGGAGVAN